MLIFILYFPIWNLKQIFLYIIVKALQLLSTFGQEVKEKVPHFSKVTSMDSFFFFFSLYQKFYANLVIGVSNFLI